MTQHLSRWCWSTRLTSLFSSTFIRNGMRLTRCRTRSPPPPCHGRPFSSPYLCTAARISIKFRVSSRGLWFVSLDDALPSLCSCGPCKLVEPHLRNLHAAGEVKVVKAKPVDTVEFRVRAPSLSFDPHMRVLVSTHTLCGLGALHRSPSLSAPLLRQRQLKAQGSHFDIRGLPTVILVSNGKPIDALVGRFSAKKLDMFVARALPGDLAGDVVGVVTPSAPSTQLSATPTVRQ